MFTKIIRYIYLQLRISYELAKIARNVDIFIFGGTNLLVLPILTAKLLRKKVLLVLFGSYTLMAKFSNSKFYTFEKILEKINYTLSSSIILHSLDLIKEWNLDKFSSKICIAHEYFLDFDKFKIKKQSIERKNIIGYIGRLSEEKGILNFIKAIPEISRESDEIEFLVGGDGELRDKIETYLNENDLSDKVKLTGWIPHEELPDYLNELKLLVIPSYTESGPIIALEAMSCGTPILATRFGQVLHRIEDGKTGFVLENNSPECIAKNVISALNCPNFDDIVKNARELVEKEFTFEIAVQRYRNILEDI